MSPYECIICHKPVYDYDPQFCCSGKDCGCMGVPLEPCTCSAKCNDAVFNGRGTMEQRRIQAGIPMWSNPHPSPTQREGRGVKGALRRIARWRWFSCFLSEYLWYRKLHGGKWMRSFVDFPVCSCLWMNVPDDADENYREPLWRGTPEFIEYP